MQPEDDVTTLRTTKRACRGGCDTAQADCSQFAAAATTHLCEQANAACLLLAAADAEPIAVTHPIGTDTQVASVG